MINLLAPIILFVYNRPWHTEETLESLMKNELADQSTLYIYCDGPKKNAAEEDFKNIKGVNAVIRKKNWCKEVIIIERDTNLGLANSVIKGVSEVIERHGKVIVLEDDIVTGKFFLKYMNESLVVYHSEEKVFGISGYKYPSKNSIKKSTYFLPISSSWSFATWKNRWDKVNFDGAELLRIIESKNLINNIDFGGILFFKMLQDQINGKNDSWAIRYYISMFLENAFFLYPKKSLIKNIGFDNSGVHCGTDHYYSKSLISHKEIKVRKINIALDKRIVDDIRRSFQSQLNSDFWKLILIRNFLLKIKRKINSL